MLQKQAWNSQNNKAANPYGIIYSQNKSYVWYLTAAIDVCTAHVITTVLANVADSRDIFIFLPKSVNVCWETTRDTVYDCFSNTHKFGHKHTLLVHPLQLFLT